MRREEKRPVGELLYYEGLPAARSTAHSIQFNPIQFNSKQCHSTCCAVQCSAASELFRRAERSTRTQRRDGRGRQGTGRKSESETGQSSSRY